MTDQSIGSSKVWLNSYPSGVKPEINTEEYTSLGEMIEEFLVKWRERDAFSCMGTTFTYSDIDKISRDFAAYLTHKLKMKKGDVLALMMPNILQYPVCLYGALRAGITVANVNPLYTPRELKHQLNDCGAKSIVIVKNFAHTLEQVIGDTSVENVITTGLGDLLKFPKNYLVNLVVKHVKKMVPPYNLPQEESLISALGYGSGKPFNKPAIGPDDIAFLQYTGGTTGVSKGAILTHANMVANISQATHWLKAALSPDESAQQGQVIITPLPLYHIFSLMANCLTYARTGGHNVLITNPRDIPGFIKELSNWKFDAFTGVNTLFNGLLNHPEFAKLDFSNLKLTLGGGMAVQKAVAERWKSVTGTPLIEAYGLTETSPAACVNPIDLKDYNGSVGLPISNTEVKIVKEDGGEAGYNEPGELWIRGPQVMKGYLNRPDETAKVLTDDGWLKTGDIAQMDDKGYIRIVDRQKDMILVSGFNVYPNEIEAVIAEHPKVSEAAAVGVPNAESGEKVKIYVVPKDKSLTKEELIAFCKQHLTGYKVPKEVEFRDELPKSNVGKILRRPLREEAIKAAQ